MSADGGREQHASRRMAAAGWLASGLIRLLRRLTRWEYVNAAPVLGLQRAGKPYVHAFYHDQLMMMTYSYQGARHGRRLAVLSSRHRDGEYIAQTLERFGHRMVRGSTGRGGAAGLRDMIRHLRDGWDVAFATDGPRGPRHRVQPGAIEAGRLGGAPIVPVALAFSKKKLFDRGIASRFHGPSPGSSWCMATPCPLPRMPTATRSSARERSCRRPSTA